MDNSSFFKKGYVEALMTLILVGAVASLGAYAYYTMKQSGGIAPGATTITVQGEGKIQAVPDIGVFSFSVLADGKDAAEAQTKSATANNAIIAVLKENGVEEKDIKTENYNLNPKYKYGDTACRLGMYCPPSNPTIDGYEVSQTVTVKVRALDKSGELISKVGEKGATNISNLSFTIDDETILKGQAREKAIVDAKKEADALAKSLGVKLVRMTGFWENDGVMYPMAERSYSADAMMTKAGNVAPDMPLGQNEIKSTVSITYEIR